MFRRGSRGPRPVRRRGLLDFRTTRNRGIRKPQVPHGIEIGIVRTPPAQLDFRPVFPLATGDVQAQSLVGDGCNPGRERIVRIGTQETTTENLHIPICPSAVAEWNDAPADSVVRWRES